MRDRKTTSRLPALIGIGLRAAREAAGLTQTALAGRMGVSQPYIAAVERGTQGLALDGLTRWAHALGVDPGSLLPGLERIRAEFGADLAGLDERK